MPDAKPVLGRLTREVALSMIEESVDAGLTFSQGLQIAQLMIEIQSVTARKCAELVQGGAKIQAAQAERCRTNNQFSKITMSVTESGTEAYMTARNSLEFWAYQICLEFLVAPNV